MKRVKEVSDTCRESMQDAHARKYGFWGYGGRKCAKITWPLVFLHLAPESEADEYLRRSWEADLRSEFAAQPDGVSSCSLSRRR